MPAPLDPPLNVAIRELKSANQVDGFYWQLISREGMQWQQNSPIKRGTKYSDIQGSDQRVIDAHPTGLFFCEEILPLRSSQVGGMPGDRFVIWVWSTDWAAQSSTNAGVTYAEESASHPIYARDYLVRRDLWQTTPTITYLSALTALVGATITAAGTGYTTATGTIGNATGVFVCSGGALISFIVTSEGSSITSGGAITITGDGAGATATAVIQPATALLVKQEKRELPTDSNLSKEFVLVRRIYETLPGPVIREDRWDEEARALISIYRQRVALPATKYVVGSTYGTGTIIAHSVIASLTITDPGSDYISLPTGSIPASDGGGTQATLSVDSLKVVGATIISPGAGYVIGGTLTIVGGTGSAATLTISGMSLSTVAINAPGFGYNPGDLITLFGGVVSSGAATVLVLTTKLTAAAMLTSGTGMVPGSTLTLAGGVATTPATVTVTSTRVQSATVAAGGASGTPGTQTVTGTTGVGTPFQASVTVDGGGAISAVLSISVPGSYTTNPTAIANEPVTGAGLVGAQLNVVMGVNVAALANAGVFTTNPTSPMTSSGTGDDNATFAITAGGLNTISVASGGGYSTTTTTFTVASVFPTGGINATFQTAVYIVGALTVANGGAYTVIPTSPNSPTGGSGSSIAVNLNFGIGAVTLTNGGTLYYANSPPVTLSFGNAQIISVSDAVSAITGVTGYVLTTELIEADANTGTLRWSAAPIPPTISWYFNRIVNIPSLLFAVRQVLVCDGTADYGIITNITKTGGNAQVRKHRYSESYAFSPAIQPNNSWVTQDVRYEGKAPGVSFGFSGVLNDAISASFPVTATGSGCEWTEEYDFAPTNPSASGFAGHWYLLDRDVMKWHGDMLKIGTLEFLA